MSKDPRAEMALCLLSSTTSPEHLAVLAPLAAPAFLSSCSPKVFLHPEDARRLASGASGRLRSLLVFLTDDPVALTVLAPYVSTDEASEHLLGMPSTPPEALASLPVPVSSEFRYRSRIEELMTGVVPTRELLSLAVSADNLPALQGLLAYEGFSADLFFSLELPASSRCGGALSSLSGYRSSRLPEVLSRPSLDAPCDPAVLASSLTRLVEGCEEGVRPYAAPEGSPARLVRSLLEAPSLALGGEVDVRVVEVVASRPELRETLFDRTDLSAAAVSCLAGKLWGEAAALAAERGQDVEVFMYTPRPWIDDSPRRAVLTPLLKLVQSPAAPLEVLERLPADEKEPSALLRLLPPDGEVWEVALLLLSEHPPLSFGQLAESARRLARS